MKYIANLILSLGVITGYCQNLESITKKISDKICDCIKADIATYTDMKVEFNRCYDQEFNHIFNFADSEEQKILVQQGALEKVKNGIIPALNRNCEKVRKVIQSDVQIVVDSTASSKGVSCPTNFSGKDLKQIRKLKGEIVAFNGRVAVVRQVNSKAYYQVELEGGNKIWIASLVNSEYEKEGRIIRLLGYVSGVNDGDPVRRFNKSDFHVLAFCIVDIESKMIGMAPGSELQVKQWLNGSVPKARK